MKYFGTVEGYDEVYILYEGGFNTAYGMAGHAFAEVETGLNLEPKNFYKRIDVFDKERNDKQEPEKRKELEIVRQWAKSMKGKVKITITKNKKWQSTNYEFEIRG